MNPDFRDSTTSPELDDSANLVVAEGRTASSRVGPTATNESRPSRPRVCFLIESGTDVRTVEGIAERCELTIVAREIAGGGGISQPPTCKVEVIVGSPSRVRFAMMAAHYLRQTRREFDYVLVQGYGLCALVANLASHLTHLPTAMLVCSPVESYYRCRRTNPQPDKPFRRHELALLELLARMNARIGRRYLVLSTYLGEVVRSHGTRRPIDFVPIYGVDTELFRPGAGSRASLKAQRGLPAAGHLLFFSSRIAPEKDSRTMLLAFKRLLDAGRDLWLLHRSGGYRAFAREAERHGIAHRVVATDAVHPRELPMDYRACDLCVQASIDEGLGFSPLEAMACGTSVIASNVGGLRETIIDGQTGWTCAVGDPAAMAAAIAAAIDDPGDARRRALAGRELVRKRFERGQAFERLERLIRDDIDLSRRVHSHR